MLSESYYLMIIQRVSIIGEMQRGCMKNAALVLDQMTFSFQRKLNLNFTQKNFFIKILCVRWLSQCLSLDSGPSIGFPVVVDGSTDSCIPTDLVEAKEII